MVRLPRLMMPWPWSNLTTVIMHCPRPGHVDEEPTTVTVSHGHALRRGHLNGRYAEIADGMFTPQELQRQPSSGRLPIVVVLRQPRGQPANGVEYLKIPSKTTVLRRPYNPVFTASAAGLCETATVTRRVVAPGLSGEPQTSITTTFYAVEVPLYFNAITWSFADLNIRLADGTLVAMFKRKRRPDYREIMMVVDGLFVATGATGDLRCFYSQRLSSKLTKIDLVIAGSAVTCFRDGNFTVKFG